MRHAHARGDLAAGRTIRQAIIGPAMLSFGFPPLCTPDARVLVLGSLPGRKSLDSAEYYAHPQNTFWKIMAAYAGPLPDDYAGRVRALVSRNVALWDVLAAATRSGSLDADISDDAIPNNFPAFFHAHPKVQLIASNGTKAAEKSERRGTVWQCDYRRSEA